MSKSVKMFEFVVNGRRFRTSRTRLDALDVVSAVGADCRDSDVHVKVGDSWFIASSHDYYDLESEEATEFKVVPTFEEVK